MPAVKTIKRPDIVHQFKEGDNKMTTTKCGVVAKKGEILTTPWHSEITCERCNP